MVYHFRDANGRLRRSHRDPYAPREWWEQYQIPTVLVEIYWWDSEDHGEPQWVAVHDAARWDTGYVKDLPEGSTEVYVYWETEQ